MDKTQVTPDNNPSGNSDSILDTEETPSSQESIEQFDPSKTKILSNLDGTQSFLIETDQGRNVDIGENVMRDFFVDEELDTDGDSADFGEDPETGDIYFHFSHKGTDFKLKPTSSKPGVTPINDFLDKSWMQLMGKSDDIPLLGDIGQSLNNQEKNPIMFEDLDSLPPDRKKLLFKAYTMEALFYGLAYSRGEIDLMQLFNKVPNLLNFYQKKYEADGIDYIDHTSSRRDDLPKDELLKIQNKGVTFSNEKWKKLFGIDDAREEKDKFLSPTPEDKTPPPTPEDKTLAPIEEPVNSEKGPNQQQPEEELFETRHRHWEKLMGLEPFAENITPEVLINGVSDKLMAHYDKHNLYAFGLLQGEELNRVKDLLRRSHSEMSDTIINIDNLDFENSRNLKEQLNQRFGLDRYTHSKAEALWKSEEESTFNYLSLMIETGMNRRDFPYVMYAKSGPIINETGKVLFEGYAEFVNSLSVTANPNNDPKIRQKIEETIDIMVEEEIVKIESRSFIEGLASTTYEHNKKIEEERLVKEEQDRFLLDTKAARDRRFIIPQEKLISDVASTREQLEQCESAGFGGELYRHIYVLDSLGERLLEIYEIPESKDKRNYILLMQRDETIVQERLNELGLTTLLDLVDNFKALEDGN